MTDLGTVGYGLTNVGCGAYYAYSVPQELSMAY